MAAVGRCPGRGPLIFLFFVFLNLFFLFFFLIFFSLTLPTPYTLLHMSSSSLSRHPHAPSLHDDDDDEDAYTESHHHRDDDDEMTENSSWFTEPHAMRVCRNQRDVIRPEDVVAVFFLYK